MKSGRLNTKASSLSVLPEHLWEERLLPHSRIHPIPMPVPAGGSVFLKREDEAGYAIAGGKLRKFASLIPFWRTNGINQVAVIGGSQSNQVLAATQILKQEGIDFRLFVKQGYHEGPGNAFLTQLLVPRSEWRIVKNEDWPQVEEFAAQYIPGQSNTSFVLPEGAWCREALPGAFSIARDLALDFDESVPAHIFIEAGTALSAIGLLLALSRYFPSGHLPKVHILLMAMDETEFSNRLTQAGQWASELFPDHSQHPLPIFQLHRPRNARSFGAVNHTVLESIVRTARHYGILTDPVYSGKLFYETERIIEEEKLAGDIVVIHSGGQSSLPGFYDKLKGLI